MTPQPQGVYPRLEGLIPEAAVKAVRTAYDYIFQLRTRMASLQGEINALPAIPLAWRSAWVVNHPYKPGDIVSSALALYIALKDNVNVVPGSDPKVWELMVQGV